MPCPSKNYLGIDPGAKGGLALVDDNGKIIEIMPMPSIDVFADTLERWKPKHVAIEKSQSLPGNAANRMFSYGVHNGELRGVLVALQIPFTLLAPKFWQTEMFIGTPAKALPKKRALQAAQRLFPGQQFLASEACRVPHDGMIDAALIALFISRKRL